MDVNLTLDPLPIKWYHWFIITKINMSDVTWMNMIWLLDHWWLDVKNRNIQIVINASTINGCYLEFMNEIWNIEGGFQITICICKPSWRANCTVQLAAESWVRVKWSDWVVISRTVSSNRCLGVCWNWTSIPMYPAEASRTQPRITSTLTNDENGVKNLD